jgi:hypothetical protein
MDVRGVPEGHDEDGDRVLEDHEAGDIPSIPTIFTRSSSGLP